MAVSPSRSVRWFVSGFALTLALLAGSATWRASASVGPDESTFVPVTPTRILDTRDPVNLGLDGPFVSPTPLLLSVTGSIPTAGGPAQVVPKGASAVSLNVTVVNPTAAGFVSVRPAGTPGAPTTSNLNFGARQTTPNAVTVSLPASGAIEITYDAYGRTGSVADMLVDVVGYTTTQGIQALVADIDDRPSDHVVAGGMVNADGGLEKSFGNMMTARTAPGRYTITLDGLDCRSFETGPTVQATLLNSFGEAATGFISTGYLPTCTGNGATVLVSTTNSTGSHADRYFQFFVVTGGFGMHSTGDVAMSTQAHHGCNPAIAECTTD